MNPKIVLSIVSKVGMKLVIDCLSVLAKFRNMNLETAAQQLGRKGGKVTSERKRVAVRKNGAKGGWPTIEQRLKKLDAETLKLDWQSLTPDQRKEWLPRFKRMDEIIEILTA